MTAKAGLVRSMTRESIIESDSGPRRGEACEPGERGNADERTSLGIYIKVKILIDAFIIVDKYARTSSSAPSWT